MFTDVPARIPARNILFATDFSPCSETVFPYVCSIARKNEATLHIVHVLSPEVLSIDPPLILEARENAERQMQDLAASEQLEGVHHTEVVASGDTTETINAIVHDNDIDLVLVGTHGRTGIRKFVLGSVAEEIVRHATCPVLTLGPRVSAEERREAKFNHILFATDLARVNEPALKHAMCIANEYHAALTLFHAIPTAPVVDAYTAVSVLRRKLMELVPLERDRKFQPEAVVEIGSPAELIVSAAATRHADLIVLGARRPAVLTTRLMDTAYRVIVEAPCPVLTVGASYQAAAA
ncbi:MAG TPA: universal stress protein [Terriglobales bacterium]|nr:universal stress protein [Terriglobales bacterium]